MKYLIATIPFLISLGCSDESVTWGEVSDEVAQAVCHNSYKCGYDDADTCMDHKVFHLCGLEDICDEPVFGSVDALVSQCTWALFDAECAEEFEWPKNCVHAFKHLRPPGLQ